MIFGLFILLIITLVVLNLFLQSAKKGVGQVGQVSTQELASQEVDRLKLNCQALCDGINDANSAIEFCASTQSLDTSQDKTKIPEKARYGKFEFCKTKVPCFIVIDNCKSGQFSMNSCKNLLLQDKATWDRYNKLVQNVGPIPTVTADDGCDLPEAVPPKTYTAADESRNWKIAGGFTLDAVGTCDPANPARPTTCPP